VWQSSDIHISEDELLTLDATGSIHIAMGRMTQSLKRQYEIKEANERDPRKNFSRSLDKFTAQELLDSTFAYPWNDPRGIEIEDLKDKSAIDRIQKLQSTRVHPSSNVGQLLAVIGPSNKLPPIISESQVIPFTSKVEKIAINKSGFIWFIINDERLTNDPIKTNIIWQDNLGMFSVNIVKQGT